MNQAIRDCILGRARAGESPSRIRDQMPSLSLDEISSTIAWARKAGRLARTPRRAFAATPRVVRIPSEIFEALKPHAQGLGISVAEHAANLLRAALDERQEG
ncbi:MAG TPA: hypothetical protein VGM17_02470 [Rhizomicrobium sp.]|jgi:hypothetical protein